MYRGADGVCEIYDAPVPTVIRNLGASSAHDVGGDWCDVGIESGAVGNKESVIDTITTV